MNIVGKILLLLTVFLFHQRILIGQNDVYLVEAENFQFKGSWITERDKNCLNGSLLRVMGGETDSLSDALTVLNIRDAGTYAVWIRTPDFSDRPSTRQMQLSVDNVLTDRAGKHGKVGFYWERVAVMMLQKKEVLLRLHNFSFGRCDAILLIKDTVLNPNMKTLPEVAKWRKNLVPLPVYSNKKSAASDYLSMNGKEEILAVIEKKDTRIKFVKSTSAKNAILCRTEVNINNAWQALPGDKEDHKIFLLSSDSAGISFSRYFPWWTNKNMHSYFEFEGKKYSVREDGDDQNPFKAAEISEAIPIDVKQIDKETIAVHYIARNNSVITGYWKIPERGYHINLRLVCKTSRPGYYSMGVAAFRPLADNNVTNVMMPPMYQYKRIPPQPKMLSSAMMPQPLVIAEVMMNGQKWSTYVSGGIHTFSGSWGSADEAPIGFSLKNEQNMVQPVAFAPVLGMNDSKYAANQEIAREFTIGIIPAGWERALHYISDSIYKVRDYRSQQQASLTDAVFNMIDLVKDEKYGGWDPALKGFYDIEGDPETAPTVVNSAPLATIALSVLTKDEMLYKSRALPTIEFTLSRSGYRWATDIVPTAFNSTLKTLLLNPFSSQFTTSYYAGLNRLLGGLNPWLKNIALPGDSLRPSAGYSTKFIPWIEALSAYDLTGDKRWLQFAESNADKYIAHQIYTNSKTPLTHTPFYNATFYAPWWHLLDMYEVTKDKKYLDAAVYGSYFTIAGIRNYPYVKDSMQTIHPGNKYEGNDRIWWKGKDLYRLGFPRTMGDAPEKKVPSWLVSPVGLGFEQPSTYFLTARGKNVRPVYMSNWAPHLLRLFQYTSDRIFETYARNAVIGRFTNYPGYYATGYTDIIMQPDFPYKGPDVSSIYYHHIPPHIAFSLDYLITETMERSKGNVSFPYSNQEGFVWFANRIYGGKEGKVFDDTKAALWLKKGLVQIINPQINYVTAISDSNFWILLSAESESEEVVNIRWSKEAGSAEAGTVKMYDSKNEISSVLFKNYTTEVILPAKGFKAVCIPLSKPEQKRVYTPLEKGMHVVDLGKPWGRVFLFRIRSPFGWDSIYGFAETTPLKKANVQAECNGKSQRITAYPYEWSFTGINMDQKAIVTLTMEDPDGKVITKKIVLDGN